MLYDPNDPRDPWGRGKDPAHGLGVYGVSYEGQDGVVFFTTVYAHNAKSAISKAYGKYEKSNQKAKFGRLETEHGTFHAYVMG